MGYYMERTYESDTAGWVSEVPREVNKGHVWGNTEIATTAAVKQMKGQTLYGTDGKSAKVATAEDDLLKCKGIDGSTDYHYNGISHTSRCSNEYVVVRDSNGDITEVKSKNCVTKAKYQLYHTCFSCGKSYVSGDVQTTDVNTDMHQWPSTWKEPVASDNEYYQIDGEKHDTHHIKLTYKSRTCELCGKRELSLKDKIEEAHKLVETKYDDEGEDETYVAPECGKDGSYDVILRCPCGFEDDESRKSTVIPATDKHDFGDNKPELVILGEFQVGGRKIDEEGNPVRGEDESETLTHTVYAQVVRKCNKCGKYDSNGINNTPSGSVGPEVLVNSEITGRTFTDYVEAKRDPQTNVPYPCSVGKITVNFKWEGKVDGESVRLTADPITVPYYLNESTYAGSRAHQADDVRTENKVDATTEAPGHFDRVVYCSVCHDEVSRETIEIAQIGSAPSIKAVSANYNTINVSWDAVEGADHYRLYYKSSDVGVTTWKLVRTVNGTSFTHSGLVTGAKYRYTVRAVLNGVNGEYDRKGSVAIPKLAAPENIAVTAVSGKNKVSWSKVDGANGYIIQRSTGSGWTRVGSVKKGAKVTWIDKKPVSGATYRVRAYRTVNDANFSKNNVYSAFSAAK